MSVAAVSLEVFDRADEAGDNLLVGCARLEGTHPAGHLPGRGRPAEEVLIIALHDDAFTLTAGGKTVSDYISRYTQGQRLQPGIFTPNIRGAAEQIVVHRIHPRFVGPA